MTYEEFIGGWCAKAGKGRMICNSNHRGPVLMPRSIALDLRARRGRSLGDWNEVGHLSRVGETRGGREVGQQTWRLGLHHLNIYVNAHFLWDAEQDLEHILDEYYRLFYGPVADQVQAAFEFAEANYTRGQGAARLSLADQVRLTEMLHAARDLAGDTIYAQRITCILEEEKPLEALRREVQEAAAVAAERARAPLVVGRDQATDGEAQTYALVDLTTGDPPPIKTSFQVAWDAGVLVFDIRCEDPDMENLFVTKDVWGGDSVAILIETPFHAYYQMEINPDGDIVDADREFGKVNMNWSSMAEVQPERGADFWRVIVRIPVMDEAAGALDPLHNVVGDKPTPEAPWFIQVGRVRIRGFDKTAYGFTATGKTYHNRQKFGRLVIE
ncbi:MAG: hypothetical protein LC725_11540 [Lentisphaerae bacterium]|nr:hypothetical protein [Lentisphaerota bacterium]